MSKISAYIIPILTKSPDLIISPDLIHIPILTKSPDLIISPDLIRADNLIFSCH